MIVRQIGANYNVAEFYNNNTNIGLLINSIGNVGIKTANPLYNLDINFKKIRNNTA